MEVFYAQNVGRLRISRSGKNTKELLTIYSNLTVKQLSTFQNRKNFWVLSSRIRVSGVIIRLGNVHALNPEN